MRGQPATQQSDTYALSVILYEFCTGVLPFRGNRPIAIMMQHINTPPTPPELMNTTLPSALPNVILNDLAAQTQNAYTGQINPTTGQSEGGALWTYNNIQRIVAFDIRPYPPPS